MAGAGFKEPERTRPDDETELCSWVDGAARERREGQVRLRSLNCFAPGTLVFHNAAGCDAKAVWLNYEGDEVGYCDIMPKQTIRFRTFATHPWIFRAAGSGQRLMTGDQMVIIATEVEAVVVIKEPPQLVWSVFTHRFFPDKFRSQVRALLVARNCYATEASDPRVFPPREVQQSPAGAAKIPARTVMKLSGAPSLHSPCRPATGTPFRFSPAKVSRVPTAEAAGSIRRILVQLRGSSCMVHMDDAAVSEPCGSGEGGSGEGGSDDGGAMVLSPGGTGAPSHARLLSQMSTDLLLHVLSFIAPPQAQCITLVPNGHPGIAATRLPTDPATWKTFVRGEMTEPPVAQAQLILAQLQL
ncbi:hypothetical protein FOA52_009741 [Chlamydomonas sp. UWO 241]|nr:hypothetical protein FOA52_009741 [Chlamydomonas sp. UWO 241]